MRESFILSNIVPQVGVGFNQDIWATLEGHVRDLAISRGELYVITGPVYPAGSGKITISAKTNRCQNEVVLDPPPRKSICGGKDKCDDGVMAPSAMFKLIYDPGMQRANVFLMPNINHRKAADFSNSMDYIKKFQVTVQALERATNLAFFHDMPLNRRRPIEQECAAVMEHWETRLAARTVARSYSADDAIRRQSHVAPPRLRALRRALRLPSRRRLLVRRRILLAATAGIASRGLPLPRLPVQSGDGQPRGTRLTLLPSP
jgi:hypothetical protein